jgi:AraC-like DNA-binding protein
VLEGKPFAQPHLDESSPKGVADVAAAVGYESEAAFNRAFKRLFGVPPAQYRRQTRS